MNLIYFNNLGNWFCFMIKKTKKLNKINDMKYIFAYIAVHYEKKNKCMS